MFLHNFKYAIVSLIKSKTALIWTLIFPIALSTFMYVAFSNIFEADEMFSTIPVAVVDGQTKQEEQMGLATVLEQLEQENEDALIKITKADDKKAKQLLKDGDIEGIFYIEEERLVVGESSTQTTILSMVLEQYTQMKNMYGDIQKEHPENMMQVMQKMAQQKTSIVEKATTDGCQNEYYNYFYAIFAMSCLFASFASVEKISKMQANTSALGMRRSLSSTHKMSMILSEYLALWLVQFTVELLTLGYMTVLGIDFGGKYPAIALTLFVGSGIGLSLGVIVGTISKLGENTKFGIATVISMILSVMADLCIGGIKNLVEQHVPILNRLNPAVLLSDCFYALNVYDNYDRFMRNIGILSGMAVLLLGVSFCLVRRNRYASL